VINTEKRKYASIDLKSFYASVECAERGLDPMSTNLVVADESRTEKTICLAVSPSLKSFGIPGRPRLFEVNEKVREINAIRRANAPYKKLTEKSFYLPELKTNPSLALDFIIAPPHMSHYMQYSAKIYDIYLKYISPDDIHVYSIDEVFIDLTAYLKTYNMTAKELTSKLISEVFDKTGITATAGIGTNLYLSKIAMDIEAKHALPDENGTRIAELDEMSYREKLWNHKPLTDFWRIGTGISNTLQKNGMYTQGDIARKSINNEDLLYKLFGVNAELIIDHAWGYEPCGISDIKAFKPNVNSISSGQVLSCGYEFNKAAVVVKEMSQNIVLDLLNKGLVTDRVSLYINYDNESLSNPKMTKEYKGEIVKDYYGRLAPKPVHGGKTFEIHTDSDTMITKSIMEIFNKITDPNLLVKRINICAGNVLNKDSIKRKIISEQLSLLDIENEEKINDSEEKEKEKKRQEAILSIKNKYGKNAILNALDLSDGATAAERNNQIGGHKA